MEKVVLSPYMIGAPIHRDREFVKLVHKQKAAGVVSPLSRFCKRFFRLCQWSWKSVILRPSDFGLVEQWKRVFIISI